MMQLYFTPTNSYLWTHVRLLSLATTFYFSTQISRLDACLTKYLWLQTMTVNPCYATLLAQCYYDTGQFKRAIHLLSDFLPRTVLNGGVEWPHPVDLSLPGSVEYLTCTYLAGKSHVRGVKTRFILKISNSTLSDIER